MRVPNRKIKMNSNYERKIFHLEKEKKSIMIRKIFQLEKKYFQSELLNWEMAEEEQ